MLNRLIFSIVLTAVPILGHASDTGVPFSFTVTPSQCVVADNQTTCNIKLTFNWSLSAYKEQICLYQQEVKLDCFNPDPRQYQIAALMTEDMEFYLKNARSGKQLARASVSMLKRARLNLYNRYVPWRVF